MYLCIDSTERNSHHLVFFQENFKKEFTDTSATLIQAVDNFLQSEHIQKEAIHGIAVVVGKGSFSSTRIATTSANTWHFAFKIPVIAIAPEQVSDLQSCIESFAKQDSEYILPTYSGEPNIGKKE